jgi:hypothetical protein
MAVWAVGAHERDVSIVQIEGVLDVSAGDSGDQLSELLAVQGRPLAAGGRQCAVLAIWRQANLRRTRPPRSQQRDGSAVLMVSAQDMMAVSTVGKVVGLWLISHPERLRAVQAARPSLRKVTGSVRKPT